MSQATNNTTKWTIPVDLGTVGGSNVSKTLTIETSGTYVDKNIEVTVSAASAGAGAHTSTATASGTIDSVTVGTKASGKYPITGSATLSVASTSEITETGYVTKGDKVAGGGSGSASLDASIVAASATVQTVATTATSPTVAAVTANDNINIGTITTTKPTAGYYAAVRATAPKTTVNLSKTINTEGYLASTAEINAPAGEVSAKTGNVYYLPISTASITTTATKSTVSGYTLNANPIIPSGGSLLIPEGYYGNTQITLDQLLGGAADTAGIADVDIRKGAVAYDVDGILHTGSMEDATIGVANPTHELNPPTYNSGTGVFDQACTITPGAVTVSTTGYISPTQGVINNASTVTENHALAKITGSLSGTYTATDTISRNAFTSTAITDAASGAAVASTATGGVYVKVSTPSDTTGKTSAIGVSITQDGYGTNTNHGLSGNFTIKHTGDTKYIPITTATAAVTSGQTITVTGGTPSLNSSTQKYDIAVSGSKNITGSVSKAGWITSVSSASVSASGTVSLNKATLTHENSATVGTSPKVTVSTAATGVATATSGSYYITVSTAATAGSVNHAASVTEGYVPSTGLASTATISVTPTADGAVGKVYLATTSLTSSATVSIAGAITGYSAPVTVAANSSVPQVKLTGSGSGTTGRVLSSNGTADNKYINYYTGSYQLV